MTARTVTNSTAGAAVNSDYQAKVTSTIDGDVQHVNIDNLPTDGAKEAKQDDIIGYLSAIDSNTSNIPTLSGKDFATETTLGDLSNKITTCNTDNVSISGWSTLVLILTRVFNFLKYPSYSTIVGGARLLKVSCDQMTTVSAVTTVSTVSTVSNLNGINSLDSRWLIFNQWNQNYRLGLRGRIN